MKIKRILPILLLLFCFLFPLASCVDENPPDSSSGGDETEGLDVLLQDADQMRFETASVIADAYVVNGVSSGNDSLDVNFGKEDVLEVKGKTNGNTLWRYTYLKFDLGDVTADSFDQVELELNCTFAENSSASLYVYRTDNDWTETGITFNNRPALGEKLAEASAVSTGKVRFNLTDAVEDARQAGAHEFSVVLSNESDPSRRLTFDAREKEGGKPAQLLFQSGISFRLDLPYDQGENPWTYARKIVNDWTARSAEILQIGTTGSEIAENNNAEYSDRVDAASAGQTSGDAVNDTTNYGVYPTRTLDTLSGYDYVNDETEQYDRYGGFQGGAKYEATGYFYTKFIDGRWWIIDPLGYPYYRVGMNAIQRGGTSKTISQSIEKKYSTVEAWAQGETDFLQDELGYNSAGAWSEYEVLIEAENPLSETTLLYFASRYASSIGSNTSTSGSTTFANGCMPVFDPDFASFCDERAKSIVEPYAESSDIFGWLLDNELEQSISMLDSFMGLDPTEEKNAYSYATVWTFLYDKLGTPYISSDNITDSLRKEFRAFLYDRYFDVTVNAVKRYDENHMILGCRFLPSCYKDEMVMKVAAYWNDIITFNYYNVWTPDAKLLADMHNWTNKPFIATEWYAKGMDMCEPGSGYTNKSGAGWTVRTQADRGKFYQNYALALMECKYFVGFDWFKMWDNDPEDLQTDLSNRNANKGIYNIYYEPYTELTDRMAELNKNKYSLISFFDER